MSAHNQHDPEREPEGPDREPPVPLAMVLVCIYAALVIVLAMIDAAKRH